MKRKSLTKFISLLLLVISIDGFAQTIAFPGAEGFGKYASGGRGGTVYKVTNLNDSGTGSLRDAINKSGKRIIVFEVSGQIELETPLKIQNGNLTIAGQTAPGGGIVISGEQTTLDADNVIIRFIRFRLGDSNEVEADAMSSRFGSNIIIDHCTFSWGVDEVMSMYRNINTTMQWCMITESLNRSAHSKGDHGYGGIWGGEKASFHHNLIAHHKSRNPRLNGARFEADWDELVDFRNNVIYNWGDNSIYGAEPSEIDGNKANINMVNNYYKYGPATGGSSTRYRIIEPDAQGSFGYSLFYIDGNYVFNYPTITADNWEGVQGVSSDTKDEIRQDAPFSFEMESNHSAQEAFEYVLRNSGVVFPYRDEVDERIAYEVATGTATYGGDSYGDGIIDSQDDVGGYPDLPNGTAPADTDDDGMPDDWENNNGFDPSDDSDGNLDEDEDGYTNLEEYLNQLVESTLAENISYVAQPAGLELYVDPDNQNHTTLSWLPIDDNDVTVIVERALQENNGPGSFEEVGSVSGGTLFSEYLDLEDNNRVYYRVKAVKGEVESYYSITLNSFVAPGVILNADERFSGLKIYPNPISSHSQDLVIHSNKPIALISVVDLTGRSIVEESFPGKNASLNTKGWKPGQYIISAILLNGSRISRQLIVQ